LRKITEIQFLEHSYAQPKHKIKIFEDKAGNKLFRKWIKTRGTWQWTATNNQGKLVNLKGVQSMITKAKRSGKSNLPRRNVKYMNQIKIKSMKKPKVLSSKPLKLVGTSV
jgi:hypothetical protein